MGQAKMISFHIKLPAKITKRKKWYLASCPVLDVHSQGETQDKAKGNLIDAVNLFLVSCLERNTLDAVLKECGFTVAVSPPRKRKPVVSQEKYIDVPIPFWVKPTHHRSCHA